MSSSSLSTSSLDSSPVKSDSEGDLQGLDLRSQFSNLKVMDTNPNIKSLQTTIRDKTTSRGDFVFSTDRLIRLVMEEALNCLPYKEVTVTTPTGYTYQGYSFEHMNCGVSIIRSGEAMERELRKNCRSMRIGKILIRTDKTSKEPTVYYARFPPEIEKRNILLMYPILETGKTVTAAIQVLKDHGVSENKVFLINLFSTPQGIKSVLKNFPDVTLLTSEIHDFCPTHFGDWYFGSD